MKKKSKRIDTGYDQVIDIDQIREERRKKRREQLEKKESMKKAVLSKRRQIKRRRYAIITTAVIILVAGFVASSGMKLWRLNREKQATQNELQALIEREGALQNELTQLKTDEYIEREARAELHMIFPGEVLYVVPRKPTNLGPLYEPEESDAKP